MTATESLAALKECLREVIWCQDQGHSFSNVPTNLMTIEHALRDLITVLIEERQTPAQE